MSPADTTGAPGGQAVSPELVFDPHALTETTVNERVREMASLDVRFLCHLPEGTRIAGRASFGFIRYASVWEDADVLCAALEPAAVNSRPPVLQGAHPGSPAARPHLISPTRGTPDRAQPKSPSLPRPGMRPWRRRRLPLPPSRSGSGKGCSLRHPAPLALERALPEPETAPPPPTGPPP